MATGSALLKQQIKPLEKYFKTPGLVEICINQPGEVWLETYQGWTFKKDPTLTHSQLMNFASALATNQGQKFSNQVPILATALPDQGFRIFVVAGAMVVGGFGMTCRIAQAQRFEVDGYFESSSDSGNFLPEENPEINIEGAAAIKQAVRDGKTILVAGGTSSGKTTLFNSLIQHIPDDTRLISIEDTQELRIEQPNKLQLLKSKTGTDIAKITYKDIINACMRMRPDRLLLGELDIENTVPFLRLINTGHGGSMATVHAESHKKALDAMVMNAQLDGIGGGNEVIERYAKQSIDIIVHIKRLDRKKFQAKAQFLKEF